MDDGSAGAARRGEDSGPIRLAGPPSAEGCGRAGCTASARLWECGWEAGPVRRAEAACEVVAGAGLAATDSGGGVAALRDVEERRRLRPGSVEPAVRQSD